MLICVFTGLISGFPLYLLIQLVPAWLTQQGVGLAEIGLFTLIGMPYVWKFVWSPLTDRFWWPALGRRRSWLLPVQICLLLVIAGLGFLRPADELTLVAVMATIIAIFGATQDIVIDAYRRELLPDAELGLGNSIHTQAYRISSIIPGSLAFVLADHLSWETVYLTMAAFMLGGIAFTLIIREAVMRPDAPTSLKAAVIQPFKEYFHRDRGHSVAAVLLFFVLYKLGDSMATALSTPFYLKLGFSMTDVGLVAKYAALIPTIVGGILGGLVMVKIGINRGLWIFGGVQLVTILGFAWLAESGPVLWILATVISAEYLGVGLGTAAFVAFMARETSLGFAATQLALFTALAALPSRLLGAVTGFLAEALGWTNFFLICTALALPGMLLLMWVAPFARDPELSPHPTGSA